MQDIDKYVNDLLEKNQLVKINDKLYLKKYQMEVLDLYHIEYKNCSTVSEILFLIDEVLDESNDTDALEEVAEHLQEFNYYHNTNK